MMRIGVVASVALSLIVLSGCGAGSSEPGVANPGDGLVSGNTNPLTGWVQVFDNTEGGPAGTLYKRCDRTTLVYQSYSSRGGVSIIANSPECGASSIAPSS